MNLDLIGRSMLRHWRGYPPMFSLSADVDELLVIHVNISIYIRTNLHILKGGRRGWKEGGRHLNYTYQMYLHVQVRTCIRTTRTNSLGKQGKYVRNNGEKVPYICVCLYSFRT